LNEKQKHILAEQDYMDGMKYKDIATKYEVSLSTVKSWKTRHGWNKKSMRTKSEKVCVQKKDAEEGKEVAEQIVGNEKLNSKQQLFCAYYGKSFNATKAYQKAFDCSYDVANAEGYKLLVNPCIKAEIMRVKRARLSKAFLEEEDIFQKYMDIAFADMTDFVEFGNEEIEYTTDSGETRNAKVSHVVLRNANEVDGTIINEVSKGKDGVKVKLADRMKALEWLTKHTSIATEEQKAKLDLLRAQTDKLQGGEQTTAEDKVAKLFEKIGGMVDELE
jgi:Phage terminase, small subunit